jgi:conjugative transposon TraN protein
MRNTLLPLLGLCIALCSNAQSDSALRHPTAAVNRSNIITYTVAPDRTVHILSPEPILYVDISSSDVDGDLPEPAICRLKPTPGKLAPGQSFTVTLVTRSLVAAYELVLSGGNGSSREAYVIAVDPMRSYRINAATLTEPEFRALAMKALSQKSKARGLKARAPGLRTRINNVFVVGEYLLFDLSLKNDSRLTLDIDEVRFKIADKRQLNAHVSQETPLTPVYSYYDGGRAGPSADWRNFYLFPRFNFASDKRLLIELSEQQISGRRLAIELKAGDILRATQLER